MASPSTLSTHRPHSLAQLSSPSAFVGELCASTVAAVPAGQTTVAGCEEE